MHTTGGSIIPSVMLAGVFPLHAIWFKGCVKGFIKRRKENRALAPQVVTLDAVASADGMFLTLDYPHALLMHCVLKPRSRHQPLFRIHLFVLRTTVIWLRKNVPQAHFITLVTDYGLLAKLFTILSV